MKKKIIFSLVMVLALMVTAAQARPRGPAADRDGTSPRFQLDLTDEQSEKVKALRETLKKDMAPIRQEMVKKQTEMKLLWLEDHPDEGMIKEKQEEINDLREKMGDLFIDFRLSMHEILTPEQRTQMLNRKMNRGSKRGFGKRRARYSEREQAPFQGEETSQQ